MGFFCTFVWVAIIVVFAWQKLDTLFYKKSVSILASVKDLHYDDQEEFTYEQGLNIAFGFTGFDDKTTWDLDPQFGELKIVAYEWNQNDGGKAIT